MIYPGSARQIKTCKSQIIRQRGRAPVGNPVFNSITTRGQRATLPAWLSPLPFLKPLTPDNKKLNYNIQIII